MRSMVSTNRAGGFVLAAFLVATLPVWAEDPADDAWRAGTAALSAEPSNAGLAEGDGGSPACTTVAPKDLRDFPLANNPRRSEGKNSVVANPKNPKLLVAALSTCGASGCRGVVYRSHNTGRTWSQPVALPDGAVGVVLAYAPNGKHLYAAYTVDDTIIDPWGGEITRQSIVVSSSQDNGETWQRPVTALEGSFYDYDYRYPRIATPLDKSESGWIYLAAVKDYPDPSGDFVFTRSADFGATWSPPQGLGWWYSTGAYGLTDGALAGGKAGEVLVVGDGRDNLGYNGVWVARSQDHGGAFDFTVAVGSEGPYGGVDVRIGHKGAAHVVYAPYLWTENRIDIKYIWSSGPPYTTWSQPVTVNDDRAGRSHVYPSLATQKCGASTVLHLVWADDRLRPWDVFYARKIARPGVGWSKNVRVSDKSSFSESEVYMSPLLAASQGRVVAVWTDRRDNPSDGDTDVYASGILSGITCP